MAESSLEKRPITASFQTAEERHDLCNKKLSFLGRFPKRYVVGIMAFFGFCNIYALRANLSIAIVAMVAKYNVTNESSTKGCHVISATPGTTLRVQSSTF